MSIMSTDFEANAYVIGNTTDLLWLHRRIMAANLEQPADSLSYRFFLTGDANIDAVAYHSNNSRLECQLSVVLDPSDPALAHLDVCIYLVPFVDHHGLGECFARGEILSRDTDFYARNSPARRKFREYCSQYLPDIGTILPRMCRPSR